MVERLLLMLFVKYSIASIRRRHRRPLSVRPVRPSSSSLVRPSVPSVRRRLKSVVVGHLQIQGRMQTLAKHENKFSRCWDFHSNVVQQMLQKSLFNVTKGDWRVCFMDDLYFRKDFEFNVEINLVHH